MRAAILRQGRHRSAMAINSAGLGRVSRSSAHCAATCKARSPVAKASARPRQNMRKISAVHGPMPEMPVSAACTAASSSGSNASRSSPSTATAAAMARNVRTFEADSPAPLKSASDIVRRTLASNGCTTSAVLVQIADALATESCCPTMMRANPSKPAGRRRSGGIPATACMRRNTGHFRRNAATPTATSASVAMTLIGVALLGLDRFDAMQGSRARDATGHPNPLEGTDTTPSRSAR